MRRDRKKRCFLLVFCFVVVAVFFIVLLFGGDERMRRSEKVDTALDAGKAMDLVAFMSGKEIFETVIRSVQRPVGPLTWKSLTDNDDDDEARARLCCVIVEPRKLDLFQHSVWNMGHVYGGVDNVALVVFHGTSNELFVRETIHGWNNVKLVNLGVDQLSYPDGVNHLLMNTTRFWAKLRGCEFALLFQADSIIRHRIPNEYFQYSYVGGPWIRKNAMRQDRLVGNGGFSLRKVKVQMVKKVDA